MCLRYLFKKRTTALEPKYIPLQSIVCEPIIYELKKCTYFKKNRFGILKKNIDTITLLKDRILLGENEHVKYDYIGTFVHHSKHTVIVNTFTDINLHTKELFPTDSITTLILTLEKPLAKHFIKNCIDYITSYKKYNSFDKSVKNFRCFKLLYK